MAPAESTTQSTPNTDSTMSMSPTQSSDPSPASDAASAAVLAAKQLFAQSDHVDQAAIRVVSADAVTWPDGSLGCPRPDQMYIQVLTDGFRVVLEAGGRQATFHTGRGNPPAVVRCDNPAPGGLGITDR